MTTMIEKHVDVQAPVGKAFEAWWRSFQAGALSDDIEQVEPAGPGRTHWRAHIAGVGEEWVAEVTERIPGRRIAWTSRAGARHSGCVTFHRLDDRHARVMLQLRIEPESWLEKLGAWLGFVDRRVEAALQEFRVHLESEPALAAGAREMRDGASGESETRDGASRAA